MPWRIFYSMKTKIDGANPFPTSYLRDYSISAKHSDRVIFFSGRGILEVGTTSVIVTRRRKKLSEAPVILCQLTTENRDDDFTKTHARLSNILLAMGYNLRTRQNNYLLFTRTPPIGWAGQNAAPLKFDTKSSEASFVPFLRTAINADRKQLVTSYLVRLLTRLTWISV